MELITQAAAVCVAGALLVLTVRQGSPVMALCLTIGVVIIILLFLMPSVRELLLFFQELEQRSGLPSALMRPLYKTMGIALVTRIGGDLCRDAGESALAAAVETAGSVCALLIALPLLKQVVEILLGMTA